MGIEHYCEEVILLVSYLAFCCFFFVGFKGINWFPEAHQLAQNVQVDYGLRAKPTGGLGSHFEWDKNLTHCFGGRLFLGPPPNQYVSNIFLLNVLNFEWKNLPHFVHVKKLTASYWSCGSI